MDEPSRMLEEIRDEAQELIDRDSDGYVLKFVDDFRGLDDWMSTGGYLPAQWSVEAYPQVGRPRRQGDGPVVLDDGHEHGKRSTYNKGCRCADCTEANREAGTRARARRKAS